MHRTHSDAPPHLVREAAQDVTYALRLLRRSPAVVAVAVLGLGLAIGVGTSAFTLLTAVTFPATGIDDPPSAVRVMRAYENGSGTSWRYSEYHLLRDGARRANVDAWFRDDTSIAYVASAESPANTSVTFATGGYLSSLSRRTTLGRLLTPADDVAGAAPVVVVSHSLWTRTLSADPNVVGRPIWLNGAPFTIVGVTARGFTGTNDGQPTIWAPIASYHLAAGGPAVDRNASTVVNAVARLGPGVTRARPKRN